MLSNLLTFERVFWLVVVLASVGFGVWVGDSGEAGEQVVVRHPETVFSEEQAQHNPLSRLVLWKEPDSSETRDVSVTLPNWFLRPERDTVYVDGGVGVDLPRFFVGSLEGGDIPIRFEDGRAIVQGADPRSGRMMEMGVDLPEDTWRGYITLRGFAGGSLALQFGTFDVVKKTGIGLVGLGVGGVAGVAGSEVVAQPVGSFVYKGKLF